MKKTINEIKNNLKGIQDVTLEKCENTKKELEAMYNKDMLSLIKIDFSSSKQAVKIVTAWNTRQAFISCADSEVSKIIDNGTELVKLEKNRDDIISQNQTYYDGVKNVIRYNLTQAVKPLTGVLSGKGLSFKACLQSNNLKAFNMLFKVVFDLQASENDFQHIRELLGTINAKHEFVLNNFNTQFMRLMTALAIKSNAYSLKKCRGALNKAINDLYVVSYKEFYDGITKTTCDEIIGLGLLPTLREDEKENYAIIGEKVRTFTGKTIIKDLNPNIEKFEKDGVRKVQREEKA